MPNLRPAQRVPVVDLFAGPGGLGEGFSSFADERIGFDVVLSVEKDPAAHGTLLLRSFFRLFGTTAPDEYYRYLRGCMSSNDLFRAFPEQAATAQARCLHLEMSPRTTPRVYSHMNR